MKNFLDISDISTQDLREIIEEAKTRKTNRAGLNKSEPDKDKPFNGKSMVMIFEKPSTRTRISFDIAVKQLGGSSIFLNPESIHYGKGNESLKDTAKVLSEYADIIMLRTSNHNVNKKEIGHYFIESVKFIKSTGAHNSKGQVIFKNINHLNKISKIENHKIFNFVCKHFEIHG